MIGEAPCPSCDGSGWIWDYDGDGNYRDIGPCEECGGSGEVPGSETRARGRNETGGGKMTVDDVPEWLRPIFSVPSHGYAWLQGQVEHNHVGWSEQEPGRVSLGGNFTATELRELVEMMDRRSDG